jgi:hypothetical protein
MESVSKVLYGNIDHSSTQGSRASNISFYLTFSKVGNTKVSLLSFSIYQFLLEGSKSPQSPHFVACQPTLFYLIVLTNEWSDESVAESCQAV